MIVLGLCALLLVACGDEAESTAVSGGTLPGGKVRHIVAIDPGHGGSDSGTIHGTDANPDLREKDITLRIGARTATLLKAAGYDVVLIRNKDQLANTPAKDLTGDGVIDIQDDQQARVDVANAGKADLFLSIHINGSGLGNDASGAETWYCAARPFKDKSASFAQLVQQETVKALKEGGYDIQDRGAHDDSVLDANNHIFVLGPEVRGEHPRATTMPGVLTEPLFITNDDEANLLREDATIDALARAYVEAIKKYYAAQGG